MHSEIFMQISKTTKNTGNVIYITIILVEFYKEFKIAMTYRVFYMRNASFPWHTFLEHLIETGISLKNTPWYGPITGV